MLETQQNVITIIVVYLFIINIDWFSLGYSFILSFNFAPFQTEILISPLEHPQDW